MHPNSRRPLEVGCRRTCLKINKLFLQRPKTANKPWKIILILIIDCLHNSNHLNLDITFNCYIVYYNDHGTTSGLLQTQELL
jgi:hypothetical protein